MLQGTRPGRRVSGVDILFAFAGTGLSGVANRNGPETYPPAPLGLVFVYRQVAASTSTQLLTTNNSPPATSSRYATLNRAVCFQPAVSGPGCSVWVVGIRRLLPESFDREP